MPSVDVWCSVVELTCKHASWTRLESDSLQEKPSATPCSGAGWLSSFTTHTLHASMSNCEVSRWKRVYVATVAVVAGARSSQHLSVLTLLNYMRGSKAMIIWGEGEPPLSVFPLAAGGAGRRLWTTLGCQGWNADEVGCRGYRSMDWCLGGSAPAWASNGACCLGHWWLSFRRKTIIFCFLSPSKTPIPSCCRVLEELLLPGKVVNASPGWVYLVTSLGNMSERVTKYSQITFWRKIM